jgi:DNA polymerase-3 subunit delta'
MLQQYLQKTWKSGKFPHSTLIAGADFQHIKNLLCTFIEKISVEEHLLKSENNPDVYIVEKDILQKSILIDQIRQLNIWVNQSSMLTKNKFAIICQAELMSFSAVNSCLKIIEEPNRNTYFFLITNSPKALPKTMLSRCCTIYQPTQSNDDSTYKALIQILLDNEVEQLQQLLGKQDINKSMKTFLVKLVKSKVLSDINLDEQEIALFSKIKAKTLEQSVQITDQISDLIVSHLTLSFDARHIATLILSLLFVDD